MNTKPFILVCDDNRAIGKSIVLLLEQAGYRSVSVTSALDCVAVARMRTPDLILMDIMMPGMDGATASDLMRDIASIERVPIVLVSAMPEEEVRIRAIEAGAADFLLKPFPKSRLLEVIRRRIDDSDTRNMAELSAPTGKAAL